MTGAPEELNNRDEKDEKENTNHHQDEGKCNKRLNVPRSSLLHRSVQTKTWNHEERKQSYPLGWTEAQPLSNFQCGHREKHERPHHKEKTLRYVANLIVPSRWNKESLQTVIEEEQTQQCYRPTY